MKAVINSDQALSRVLGDLRAAYAEARYVRVSWTTGKDRSLDQNAIGHAWYEQISTELREDTPEGVKCECKLRYGVPILRAEDEQFRAFYDAGLKRLSYEQKLTAMRYVPVTSLMTVPQKSRYLETMQMEYAKRGVMLRFPEDEK